MVDLIFVLTAPFDEEEKTGDGQYARSLVEGFSQYSTVQCIWLKEQSLALHKPAQSQEVYYQMPARPGVIPIPANTIPSVYALQPVANKKTVLSGYQLIDKRQFKSVKNQILKQITPRTPKIITDKSGLPLFIGFYRDKTVVQLTKEKVSEAKSSIEKEISLFNHNNIETIYLLSRAQDLLAQLDNVFSSNFFNENQVIEIIDKLSGAHEDNCYNFVTNRAERISKIIDAAGNFKQAYNAALLDRERQKVMVSMIHTMQKAGLGKKCAIDIHIRPPDTGAFISAQDITFLRNQGFIVNVTVHEYKQNYTRPYLQQLTHTLMQAANSVLFFNEKDRKNAIKASKNGYTDSKRPHTWPIDMYDLNIKSGLTVASQVLSNSVDHSVEFILNKAPNILCFGTIRQGKGFEIAVKIAKIVNARASQNLFTTTIPRVIIAGDPQCTSLMEQILTERYGKIPFENYLTHHPYPFSEATPNSRDSKISYWNQALNELDSLYPELQNPHLEVIAWIEDLAALKDRCKYVIRFDDMGMRNNGSAIISVLNVGIIYTKWGCVTDAEYQPDGVHSNAINLCTPKYGLDSKKNKELEYDKYKINQKKSKIKPFTDYYSGYKTTSKVESDYKRGKESYSADEIFNSIMAREENQKKCSDDLNQSRNYITIVAAKNLLATKFTLENSVLHLTQAIEAQASKNSPKGSADNSASQDLNAAAYSPDPGILNENQTLCAQSHLTEFSRQDAGRSLLNRQQTVLKAHSRFFREQKVVENTHDAFKFAKDVHNASNQNRVS